MTEAYGLVRRADAWKATLRSGLATGRPSLPITASASSLVPAGSPLLARNRPISE
jgi:hypothetical protein